MKKSLFAIILLGFSFSILSCDKKTTSRKITIIDMEGTSVSIPAEINRVACISQSATDLMIAFGLGEKIYGTYRSFTYNPWTTELYPPAKNFKAYSYSVSAEELLSDKIDLGVIVFPLKKLYVSF